MVEVLTFASDNVRRFHEAQMPEEMWTKEMHPGVFAGDKVVPIDFRRVLRAARQGLLPQRRHDDGHSRGWWPAFPPAGHRHVRRDPTEMSMRQRWSRRGFAGVEKVYKCGGAQASGRRRLRHRDRAALPQDRRAGQSLGGRRPSGSWPTASTPGIPAGPSEAIILADETANGAVAALDLLIEAEHGPELARPYLVTPSRAVAEAARAAIPGYWAEMGAPAGWSSSAAVLGGPRGGIRAGAVDGGGGGLSSTTMPPSTWRS